MEKISNTLASLRKDYGNKELNLNELLVNPIDQFKKWLDEAIKIEANEPNAMAISTVTDENTPRSRYVLFKDLIEGELIFHTHYESPKAKEILNNPNISGIFYWPEIHRQIRFEGICKKASSEVSDDYFNSRPRGGQLSAIASNQSQAIQGRIEIEEKIAELEIEYKNKEIQRPDNWGGFSINADYWEFWQGRDNRTHDRFTYFLQDDKWKIERLSP
ncbi:MAG: pyridoxamine 5'-phosphate oxidase [Candidatus Actinomarina sp.]|nr:pyridoxamine 5'-phosphate oxidase [Candidatus Actinomarina sp.]